MACSEPLGANILRELEDELTCKLCGKLYEDPHTVPICGHAFCYSCICGVLEGPGITQSQCPLCRKPVWKKDLSRNHKYQNLVHTLNGCHAELRSLWVRGTGVLPSSHAEPLRQKAEATATTGHKETSQSSIVATPAVALSHSREPLREVQPPADLRVCPSKERIRTADHKRELAACGPATRLFCPHQKVEGACFPVTQPSAGSNSEVPRLCAVGLQALKTWAIHLMSEHMQGAEETIELKECLQEADKVMMSLNSAKASLMPGPLQGYETEDKMAGVCGSFPVYSDTQAESNRALRAEVDEALAQQGILLDTQTDSQVPFLDATLQEVFPASGAQRSGIGMAGTLDEVPCSIDANVQRKEQDDTGQDSYRQSMQSAEPLNVDLANALADTQPCGSAPADTGAGSELGTDGLDEELIPDSQEPPSSQPADCCHHPEAELATRTVDVAAVCLETPADRRREGHNLVGLDCEVWWQGDECFYHGHITECSMSSEIETSTSYISSCPGKYQYTIQYKDGEIDSGVQLLEYRVVQQGRNCFVRVFRYKDATGDEEAMAPDRGKICIDPKDKVIIASGIASTLTDVLGEFVKSTGDATVEDFASKYTTHVVVATDANNLALSRSSKYLVGVARGLWILNHHWITDSVRMGFWQPEEKYEIAGDQKCRGGPASSRLARRSGQPLLLSGTWLYLVDETFPGRKHTSQLITILEACGGKVVKSLPDQFQHPGRKTPEVICIVSTVARPDVFIGKHPLVKSSWVVDSISAGMQLATEPYLLSRDALN